MNPLDRIRMKKLINSTERKLTPHGSQLTCNVIDVVGIPEYVTDITQYIAYGITECGWYVFADIAGDGKTVTEDTTVIGAEGYIAEIGADHVSVAVRFDVAALSKMVTVNWGACTEEYVFRSTDLAARNLDYRVTFYIYDIAPYATWSYALTADTAFVAGKQYYTKDENDVYTLAEVTAGDTVPPVYYTHAYILTTDETFQTGKTYYTESGGEYTAAEVTPGESIAADTYYEDQYTAVDGGTFEDGTAYYTKSGSAFTAVEVTPGNDVPPLYYNHSKLTFSGMVPNVTYKLDEIVDCPIEIVLPEVADDGHGAWFEIQMRYDDTRSCTLIPPTGVKIGTAQTQAQGAGINTIDLQYTVAGNVKMWTLLNTHSNIPA